MTGSQAQRNINLFKDLLDSFGAKADIAGAGLAGSLNLVTRFSGTPLDSRTPVSIVRAL
jgi:hypothetical protein